MIFEIDLRRQKLYYYFEFRTTKFSPTHQILKTVAFSNPHPFFQKINPVKFQKKTTRFSKLLPFSKNHITGINAEKKFRK